MDTPAARASLVPPLLVAVMGVSGAGKTVIASRLAERLGGRFIDGDDYHPPANVERMANGIPLRDEDRWAWLDAIGTEIEAAARDGATLVVACSALKRRYRDRLRRFGDGLFFVYLDIDRSTAAARVAGRKGHFMPASLVESQFADLEPPAGDEAALTVDGTATPGRIVAAVAAALAAAHTRRASLA